MKRSDTVLLLLSIIASASCLATAASSQSLLDPFADPAGDHPPASLPYPTDTGEVTQVDPSTLQCNALITFDDVPGGPEPGTNYDGVLETGNAAFAERFVGQDLTVNGVFDALTGTASNPLLLQNGSPNQNVDVLFYDPVGSQVASGLGPAEFPNFTAIGEGSLAVLFDFDQSEVGFSLVGTNDGAMAVTFFRRNGTLIEIVIVSGLVDGAYGFRRAGGIQDIAGMSIHNVDPDGFGIDTLCHDVGGVPGQFPICDAGGPYSAPVNVPIQFDGSGSFDPDGSIVDYQWDFGDGSPAGSGPAPVHTYTAGGIYVVRLCVVDEQQLPSCCETRAEIGATAVEAASWGQLKARYRD